MEANEKKEENFEIFNINTFFNFSKDLNQKDINPINNNTFNYQMNNLKYLNDAFLTYLNILNYNIIEKLKKINEEEAQYYNQKELGLKAISNKENINHYLLNDYNYLNNNFLSSFLNNPYNYKLKNNKNRQNYTFTINNITNNPQMQRLTTIEIKTSFKKINKESAKVNENLSKINENNIINFELIKSGKETRTVVRLHPIPKNYSSFDICKLLDKYLKIEMGKNQRIYKALNVPLSKVIGKNLGYCFVMMVEPKYVIQFYNTFNGLCFNKKSCRKQCSVVWANIQGDNFLNISDDPLRSPIIFKDLIKD